MIIARKLMIGNKIHNFVKEIWPINASITSEGIMLTLKIEGKVETIILNGQNFYFGSIAGFMNKSCHENDNRLVI